MVEEKSATLPSSMRRMRLRQLKKILPSDRISIEKHFPRFHQKCQTLKMNRIKSTADISNIDDVQDLRLNVTIGSDQPTLSNQFENAPDSEIDHLNAYHRCNLLLLKQNKQKKTRERRKPLRFEFSLDYYLFVCFKIEH